MTGDELIYEYTDIQAPLKKINYSYSKFYGSSFLAAWRRSRIDYLDNQIVPELGDCFKTNKTVDWNEAEFVESADLLDDWIYSISASDQYRIDLILLLIKRFEVTKKVYTTYSELMRPKDKTEVGSMTHFGKWGIVLALVFDYTGRLPALNGLIKVNDILISNPQMKPKEALKSISMEVELVEKLIISKLNHK